jgi:hypothetical protein
VANEDDNPGQDDEDLVGKWYSDRFRVGHNAFEFKVDCGHEREGGMASVFLRLIASPKNARELFRQLGVGLLRHSDRFGRDDDNDAGRGGT